MTEDSERNNRQVLDRQVSDRQVSDRLHPLVPIAAVGCVLWFVLAAWTTFGGFAYMDLVLAVVRGFFLMALLIPFALWLTWRRQSPDADRTPRESFRDWISGEFETGQGRRKASDAMIEVLLPLAAGAVGMTALGVIFHVIAANAVPPGTT
jgi:hypothetical protein